MAFFVRIVSLRAAYPKDERPAGLTTRVRIFLGKFWDTIVVGRRSHDRRRLAKPLKKSRRRGSARGRMALLARHAAAGVDPRVIGLVYIAAVAPDAGETVQNQLDKYPSDIFTRVEVADGRAWMLPNGTEFFAGDLPQAEQKLVWATHYAPVFDLFHQQKLTADRIAWRSKPSWYVLATKDHTVHPDLQRWVSKRMGATVTEVASSHVPMLSQPDVVIGAIRKAVQALAVEA
jgi:pimeloyl-ACP methyl ester carboxylesterase